MANKINDVDEEDVNLNLLLYIYDAVMFQAIERVLRKTKHLILLYENLFFHPALFFPSFDNL